MFEKLLQKVIMSYFGDYLNGIDANNLHVGIWNGDIRIENVSLNEQKINHLMLSAKLPFELIYSHVGGLRVVVPWNKLSSMPVEITLNDVYLFLRMKDTGSKVELNDIILNKKELVKNYCEYLSTKLLGEKKEDKEAGYLNKMIAKIIDNIQLKIENIHIRVQGGEEVEEVFYSLDEQEDHTVMVNQEKSKSFAFGFCIKSINAYTTDQEWNKKFIDRSDNKDSEMRKKLFFEEISLYWEQRDIVPMTSLRAEDTKYLMSEIISRREKRLLSISGEIKFIEGKERNKPQYELTTTFEQVQIEMNFEQLRGIIELGEKISEYKTFQKAINQHLLPEQDQLKLQHQFKTHIQHQFNTKFQQLSQQLSSILIKVNKQNLLKWTKQEITTIIKKRKIELKEKEKNQKKWWNFLSYEEIKITQEEEEEIGKLMNEIIVVPEDDREANSPWISLNVEVKRGTIGVLHNSIQQLFYLQYQGMATNFHLQKNKKYFSLNLSLSRSSFKYIKYQKQFKTMEEIVKQKVQLCEIEIIKQKDLTNNLIEILISKEELQVNVKLISRKVEMNYETRIILLIKELMKVRNNDQLNSMAWNAMAQKIQQRTKEREDTNSEQLKKKEPKIEYKINVDIEGVYIIILLEENEHLVASFNKIWIKDIDANNKQGCIENLNVRYINKTKHDVNNLRYSQIGSQQIYLIHPLNPSLSLEVTETKNNIKLDMGNVYLNMNKIQIVKIRAFIDKQLEIGEQQKKRPYKELAQEQSEKSGEVKILNTFKTWKKYYAILTDSHIEFFEEDQYTPIIKWFIKNCVITELEDNKLKLESTSLNEILECKDESERNSWKSKIQEVVITNTWGNQLYEMFDELESKSTPNVNLELKQTIFNLQISQLQLVFEEQKPVLRLYVGGLNVVLIQSKYFFNRTVIIDKFQLADLRQSKDSEYYSIIKSNTYSNIHQFNKEQSSRLELKVHGKKKFHPSYKSQLFIKGSLGGVTINFNPRIFLHFIRLLGKKKTKYQFNEKTQREDAIFGYTKNFLQSNFFQELEQSIQSSKNIQNKTNFTKFSEFEKSQKMLVMLDVEFLIKSVRINLIHRTTKCCNNTIQADNLSLNIKNGNNFMFIEIGLLNARIFDNSNYPNTINNFQNESDMVPYELVSPSKPEAAIKVWFSTFENYAFTNLQRTSGFFLLTLDDFTIMYQQQPFMRFIDYLNNQLISFLLKPYSVDIYQYKYNKEFKFSEYEQFTTKEVEKIIEGLLLPFFTSLTVEVNNSIIHFNSHPGMESMVINVDKVVVESKDLFTKNRVEIDNDKLKLCRERKNFKDLESNLIFNERILKGCWVQQIIISLKNMQIGQNTSHFDLIIDFQRLPNCQRSLLFPFIQQDKTMMLSGVIDNIQLKLTKQFYNLLLKCMIHNLTYDDTKDSLYQHNYKYQHLMEPSPMSNLIRIKDGTFLLPEIQGRMQVKDLEYWFVRDKNQEKKMMVNIKRLQLFKRDEQIIAKDWKEENENLDEYDLEYEFTSEKNFDKKMTVRCNNLRVFAFDLDIFKKIGGFVGVPQQCFPDTGEVGDMPMITCNVELNNSVVAFAHLDEFAFIAEGNIIYIWNRNRSRNYELVKQDRVNGIKVPDIGVTTSHIIYLKGLELKKVSNHELMLGKSFSKLKVRKLSTPISVFLRINDILKFSPNHTIYYDKSIYYSLQSVGIIMSYQDISQIIGFFSPPPNPDLQQLQPPKQPQQFNPYQPSSTTQHNLIIYNFQFQILASSPQAPLMSVHINDGKLKCTQMRNHIPLHSLFKIGINYYNLRVGVWEPVLEEVEISVEMKWGTEKYLRVECKESLLIDVSVEFIKLLKLLLNDINSINSMNTNKSSVKNISLRRQTFQPNEQARTDTSINNISPYKIINNLGCQLTIESEQGDQKYILQPCQSINYQTKNEIISSNELKRIKLTINDNKSIHEIHDIDLDKIKNKLMRIEFGDRFVDIKFIAVYREIIKEIIISSCYLIKNDTIFDIELQANDKLLKIKRGEQSALPYTLLFQQCTFTLNFPHLQNVKQNFAFSSQVIIPHYQHYILSSTQMFNCNIQPDEDQNNQIMSIVVSPLFLFRNSLPCNIKIQLFWKVNGVEKRIEDQLGIQEEKGYHQIGSKDELEIKIKLPGFHFSQSEQLYDPNNKEYQLEELQINDYRGNTGRINLKCSKKNRVKRYTFYSTGLIINETDYELYFYDGGALVPGQKLQSIGEENRLCFIGDLKYLNMSMGDDNANRSQYPLSSTLELIQLGSNNFSVNSKHKMIEFGTYTDLYCVDAKQSLYSRIIQVTPKYIIVNKCSFPLKIKHYQSDRSQNIGVEDKTPLEWDNRHRTKFITVSMESEDKKWGYSEPIDFQENASILSFVLRSEIKEEEKCHMKMEIVKELQYQYLIISEVIEQKDYLISVHNQLTYVRIELYQKIIDQKQPTWIDFKQLKLRENGNIEQYGFDYPNQSKQTAVTFKFIGPLRSDYDDYTFTVDLSLQSYSTQLVINSNVRQKQIIILVTIQSIAGKRHLKFNEKKENNDHEEIDEFVLLRLGVSFKEVGISMIGSVKGKRCQIIYLTMKECELMLLEKSTIRTIQLKIKYINIDNNSNHNSSNPVVLTPQKQQKAMKSPRPFLLFLLEQNLKNGSSSQIKSIRVSIQPTSIRLDDEFFQVIRGFVKQINNNTMGIEETDLIPLITASEFAWNNRDLKSLTSETFVQEFEIAKITLKLSFSMRPKGSSSNNQLIYLIIKSFGVLIAKISDTYITFSRILLVGRNITQIKKEIMSRYYKQISGTIISVIASVNLLGNPYKIVRHIGQGFVDVINYPVQGFIKGPIEGVFGIVVGGVGFIKNIVAGTFSGLESVSESVSSGLSSLTMDQKFIERREKIKNHQTKHLGSGIVYGLYSIVGGIELSFSGLYRQPVQGYNNNGVLGGVTGTVKALLGMFLKPLSGSFNGISKFSEGIKNTALLFQDGPKTQRERPPRIFYGEQYTYRSYDDQEAQSVAVLQYISTKYLNIVILELISFDNQDSQEGNMLLISSSFVCLFNRKKKKVYWDEQVSKISHVRIREGAGVIVHTKQKQELFIETSKAAELMNKLMLAVKLNSRIEGLDED